MQTKKLEILDAIRGFVAIYVFAGHLVQKLQEIGSVGKDEWWVSLVSYGGEGVFVFFILSGFVIEYSFSRSKDKSFKLYFFKRFTRIYIPLITVFIITAIIYPLEKDTYGFSVKILIGNLLMLQDITFNPNVFCEPLFRNGPLWSLSYEWWYYMIYFAIMAYVPKIKRKYVAYALILVATISLQLYIFQINRWVAAMVFWWFGREMAVLYSSGKEMSFKNLALPFGSLIVYLLIVLVPMKLHTGAIYDLGQHMASYYYKPYIIILGALILAILWYKSGFILYKYTLAPFKHLAKISYGIYIAHYPLVIYAGYFSFIENVALRYIAYTASLFVFAYVAECIIYPRVTEVLKNKIFPKKAISSEV